MVIRIQFNNLRRLCKYYLRWIVDGAPEHSCLDPVRNRNAEECTACSVENCPYCEKEVSSEEDVQEL